MSFTTSPPKQESDPQSARTETIKAQFDNFILENDHPCVMAQTVFSMDHVDFHVYDKLGSKNTVNTLLEDLKNYISKFDFDSNEFLTFLAVFPNSPKFTEKQFEEQLWQQLQDLHEADTVKWDPEVDSDPAHDNFSFSLGGKAFYIVGLHPNSSRLARQSPYPAIAFNLHWQFEKLRDMGSYEVVRDRIRERDKALQGEINPMLRDFGVTSEAKQYSGREVDKSWKCPFHQTHK